MTTAADTDIDVARDYALAYAAFDETDLRGVLAERLQFRQVNPGGYLQLNSAEDYIAATRDFVTTFDSHQPDSSRAAPVGDRIATASRMRLTANGQHFVMEHQEFLTIRDGKVVAIDSVCTGARPLSAV